MSRLAQQLIFIIVITNAGGQGKTLLARLCKSLWLMTGRSVQLLCSDPGSAMSRMLDEHAKRVGWGVDSSVVPEIVSACSDQFVVLDCGANLMASQREIVELVPELARQFEAAGYRTVALMPYTPNKLGAVGLLEELAPKLPPMETILIRSNADGSRHFQEGRGVLPSIDLGHLKPGILAYLNDKSPASFFDLVQSPAADRTLVGRYVGDWMRNFAKQASKHDLFPETVPLLKAVPTEPAIRFAVDTPDECTDGAIRINQYQSRILADIEQYGWTPDGLRKAATALEQRSV